MNTAIKYDNFAEDYRNLDLHSGELSNIEFDQCTFTQCNFAHTLFKSCLFTGCVFRNCELSLMRVINSKFSDVIFVDCKVIGVDWTKANWDSLIKNPMKFEGSVLNGSSFYGLCLEELILKECEAKDVDFTGANLSESTLTYTNFSEAVFSNTNLSKANFSYAENFDIDIKTNTLKGAIFSRYDAIRLLSGLGIELID